MSNSITKKEDYLEVVFDPGFIVNQPTSLPGEDGQPYLTGFTVGAVLVQLAKQIIAAKAPDLYPLTNVPALMAECVVLKGQFVIRFTPMSALGLIPAGDPLVRELAYRARKNAAATDVAE